MPLDYSETAPGRRVRLAGQELDVRGTLNSVEATRFLVVSDPESHACALIPQAVILEEGEAVDPEEVEAQRNAPVTDDTGVTDAGDTPPSQEPPQDPDAPANAERSPGTPA